MTVRDWLRPIYVLLIFVPISVALAVMHASDTLQFGAAAIAIVPLSATIGRATEELAKRLGAQWGGLLNATFGNATELIIGLFALHEGLLGLVRASIIGSIIGNILLVLGACALAGGLRFRFQEFNQDLAQTNSITLVLATSAIAIPAIFANAFNVTAANGADKIQNLSVSVAILLLFFYVASLVFSLRTHEEIFRSCETDEGEPACWTTPQAIAALALTALVVSYESERLVHSVQGATAALHLNQVFVGIILVPLIGNAAEHASAVTLALKNKMDVSINIAIGSSIQVAMFVAPFLVLCSLFLGHPLSFVFPTPELAGVIVAALISAFIASDGKTHWLEGMQLLAAYLILALAFFFLPG